MMPLAKRLCCPCQRNPRRHHVEPHLLGHIDKLQDLEAVHDPKHGADSENKFMVIGDLTVDVAVFFPEAFPHKTDMDAAHRASGAGSVSEQRDLGEPLAGDALGRRIGSCLEVPDRQGLQVIHDPDVAGSAEVMVFAHHVGAGHVLIDFIKDLDIVFAFRKQERTVTMDHYRLQVLRAHHRPAAQSAEVAIGVGVDTGHGRLPLPCRTDPEDRPVP